MCKWSKWGDTRIDPCMKKIIEFINNDTGWETIACCCGHGKYPMTIVVRSHVVKNSSLKFIGLEIFSRKYIPRIKRFYKRDKQGYYYIPEVIIT